MSVSDQVIQQAAAGDREAQRQIYECFNQYAYRIIRRIVGESNAEDVTHDVFIRLFAKLDTFRNEAAFTTWLHRLVVNQALQFIRGESRSNLHARSIGEGDWIASDAEPDHDNAELLEKVFSRIDPELRLIFELKEVDLCSYAEIAHILNIPEGTVGSRLNRARRELRDALAQLGWEY